MPKFKLCDICEFITDGTHQTPKYCESGGYIFLSSKDVTSHRIDWANAKRIPGSLHEKLYSRLAPRKNDVLLAKNGTTGVAAIVDRDEIFDVYVSLAVLRPKAEIFPEYLLYAINSPICKRQFDAGLKGVGVPNLHLNVIRETEISVPSYSQQIEICKKLRMVLNIIEQRNNQLKKMEDLIKARFVEMFGNPFSNPMGWPTITFKEAGNRLSDGPFGSNLKSEHYTESGVRVIRLGNIGVGRFIDNDKSYVSIEHYEKLKKYTCRAGEIVIGTLGEPNLRACKVPEDVGRAINKADCVHFIPKANILNNDFVCQYINCPETLLLAEGMIHGQTRSRVSSGQIAQMPIFIPPMELQESFSAFATQVDKSKVAVQKSLDETKLLFDSLMQEYFG